MRRHRGRIGCSGWNYRSWRGRFYPDTLPTTRWLDHYSSAFDTVEVNNTFYRLPESSTFAAWRTHTPRDFVMAIKASRYLTHIKRLRDPAEPLQRLFERAAPLGRRLGPVLYQLPGSFRRDVSRLAAFLTTLPRTLTPQSSVRVTHVMEFRHPSWYVDDTFQLLEAHGVGLCAHDMAGSEIETLSIGPCAYVRFHGASGRYHGSYDQEVLQRWALRLADQWSAGRRVYVYFNNDPDAIATLDALRLRALLEGEVARRSAGRPDRVS